MGWKTPALLASALEGSGIDEVWRVNEQFFKTLNATGELNIRRREQSVEWMHALIMESLRTVPLAAARALIESERIETESLSSIR